MTLEQHLPHETIFDPKIHLQYQPPNKKFSLEDLKLPKSATSTEIAATVPFPILSPEGVRAYRQSLFSPQILQNCASSPYASTLILRNAANYSKFVRDFWTHPETLRIVSDAAGVPLSIIMPTEIGHTNIQTSGDSLEDMVSGLSIEPDTTKLPLSEEERLYDPLKTNSIIPWHYDSYPYVCVVTLSDTVGMVGGETYIKGGDGAPLKVSGPALGYGVLLQGGEVQHLAARGLGVKERITTITSYRANVQGVYDSSYLSNVRPYCDRSILYKQWAVSRLDKMSAEIEALQREIQAADDLDVEKIHLFAQNQGSYLRRTARQLIPPNEYNTLYKKFGMLAIQNASKIWAQAELLSEFQVCVAAINETNYMLDSPLWVDLAETRIYVKAGRILHAQTGSYRWVKEREYAMGDELLRQGLPELFLGWLDATGLYSLLPLSQVV